jgi:hypothetical protein
MDAVMDLLAAVLTERKVRRGEGDERDEKRERERKR